MRLHELKTWPDPFRAILTGAKKFEVRKNDRDFRSGDFLLLREWGPETMRYSGREIVVQVDYVAQGSFGLPAELCVMSLGKPAATTDASKAWTE